MDAKQIGRFIAERRKKLLNGECNRSVEEKEAETQLVSAIEYTKNRNAMLAKRYMYWFLITALCLSVLVLLMHLALFSQLGVSGMIVKEHLGFTDGGATMTNEMMKVVAVIFAVMLFGIGLVCFPFWFLWENRKRNRLQGLTEGQVIGPLKSGLFKNKTTGEFPGGVLTGWGVARGEQYWGGTFKGKWQLNQNVTVLYNPKKPRIAYLEGDDSYIIHHRIYLCVGIVVVLFAVLAYVILFL